MNKIIIQTVCVIFSVLLLFVVSGTPALAGIRDGKMSANRLSLLLGEEYLIWHFDGQRRAWQVFDSKAWKDTNTFEIIAFSKDYFLFVKEGFPKIELKKGWNFVKGSLFLWASVKEKRVEDITEEKFEELGGMSVNDIVRQAWKEALGKEAPILAVSSLDSKDFLRLFYKVGGKGQPPAMFYSYRLEPLTSPLREDKTRIVAQIVYPRKSAELRWAIWFLAHEKTHDYMLRKDWEVQFLPTSFQEDIADIGAAIVYRHLQEEYDMPRLIDDAYDKRQIYGWTERMGGTPEMRREILTGYPSASSLVSLFKSLR